MRTSTRMQPGSFIHICNTAAVATIAALVSWLTTITVAQQAPRNDVQHQEIIANRLSVVDRQGAVRFLVEADEQYVRLLLYNKNGKEAWAATVDENGIARTVILDQEGLPLWRAESTPEGSGSIALSSSSGATIWSAGAFEGRFPYMHLTDIEGRPVFTTSASLVGGGLLLLHNPIDNSEYSVTLEPSRHEMRMTNQSGKHVVSMQAMREGGRLRIINSSDTSSAVIQAQHDGPSMGLFETPDLLRWWTHIDNQSVVRMVMTGKDSSNSMEWFTSPTDGPLFILADSQGDDAVLIGGLPNGGFVKSISSDDKSSE